MAGRIGGRDSVCEQSDGAVEAKSGWILDGLLKQDVFFSPPQMMIVSLETFQLEMKYLGLKR